MDIFLSFLVAAIIFGFQIYSNFKKEQEKAKKRVSEKRGLPEEKHQTKAPDASVNLNKTAVHTPDELTQTALIHKPHRHQFERLEHYQIETEEVNPYAASSFDLRDAVIKMAILNRPYADEDY